MKRILIAGIILGATVLQVQAGNPDRRGEAGSPELLMNGYARSAGLWGLNCANVKGMEAEGLNPAGLAKTQNMEVVASYNSWLSGSGLALIQGGIVKKVKTNAFALSVQALNFGSIERTTVTNPEGNLGSYNPSYISIAASYAKNFSLGSNKTSGDNVITGGINVRMINEIVDQVSAAGIGFDLGLQYTTGKKENFHIGVSLRNVGTPMKYSGDGLNFTTSSETGFQHTEQHKTNKFELPTQLNMGIAYDIFMGHKIEIEPTKFTQNYRLTIMGQYSANAFGFDNYGVGVEFGLRELFMLRAAYRFENSIWNSTASKTAYNGVAAGLSFNVPFKKNGPALGIDYGIRLTGSNSPFNNTHTIGLRFNLGGMADKQRADELTPKEKEAMAPKEDNVNPRQAKRAGKRGKVTMEDLEERDAKIDSLNKLAEQLKIKAATPIVKIDTVTVVKTNTIIHTDTILVPTVMEKSDYKGGDIDTVTQNGKKVMKFNDYEALQFDNASDKIQAKSYSYLNYLVNILKSNPSYRVRLDGHTDNVGDHEGNVKLSKERVEAAKKYFESKGISGGRIDTNAFGPDKPKYKNDSAAGRAKNRRVEIFMEM